MFVVPNFIVLSNCGRLPIRLVELAEEAGGDGGFEILANSVMPVKNHASGRKQRHSTKQGIKKDPNDGIKVHPPSKDTFQIRKAYSDVPVTNAI